MRSIRVFRLHFPDCWPCDSRCAGYWLSTAQQTLGGITGEVTDASGGVIPNVDRDRHGRTDLADSHTKTNGTGVYTFVNLPIGTLHPHLYGGWLPGTEDAAHHGAGRPHGDA